MRISVSQPSQREFCLENRFNQYRQRLFWLVDSRLDRRLRPRLDADDVLQEVYIDAADRIAHFVDSGPGSFFQWLRMVAAQTITDIHRRHIGARMRDCTRERSVYATGDGREEPVAIVVHSADRDATPSESAIQRETSRLLDDAINHLRDVDREVIRLRHTDSLANREVAELLGITEKAASIRYRRAIRRLRVIVKKSSPIGCE